MNKAYKILIICFLGIFALGDGYAQNKKAEAFLKSARTAFDNRSYDDALHYVEKALRADETSAEAWLMKSEIYKA